MKKEMMHKYYSVLMVIYDDGRSDIHLAETRECKEKPINTFKSLRNRDMYVDWFDNKEQAIKHMESCKE